MKDNVIQYDSVHDFVVALREAPIIIGEVLPNVSLNETSFAKAMDMVFRTSGRLDWNVFVDKSIHPRHYGHQISSFLFHKNQFGITASSYDVAIVFLIYKMPSQSIYKDSVLTDDAVSSVYLGQISRIVSTVSGDKRLDISPEIANMIEILNQADHPVEEEPSIAVTTDLSSLSPKELDCMTTILSSYDGMIYLCSDLEPF